MAEERLFYHSFPRRRPSEECGFRKGLKILSAVRDFGLLLVPEYIVWKQPLSNGGERPFPILQKRFCLTELSRSELAHHSQTFGPFSLEFHPSVVRRMGAIPVFYLPQPVETDNGNALGVALLATAMDAQTLVNRMAVLDSTFNGEVPVADVVRLDVSFSGTPDGAGKYDLDSKESRNFLSAVGHGITPLASLDKGLSGLLSMFYPADDTRRDGLLNYYRQLEWRIAAPFAINGAEVMRPLEQAERDRLLKIDEDFFSRRIKADLREVETLDETLVLSDLEGVPAIQLVRRAIVPDDVVNEAREILASCPSAPEVVALSNL